MEKVHSTQHKFIHSGRAGKWGGPRTAVNRQDRQGFASFLLLYGNVHEAEGRLK